MTEMVRELQELQRNHENVPPSSIKAQKQKIIQWLRSRGVFKCVPWGTGRTAGRPTHKRVVVVDSANKPATKHELRDQDLLINERRHAPDKLAAAHNGQRHEHNGHVADHTATKVLRRHRIQLVG